MEWISIKERMPKTEELVLVIGKFNNEVIYLNEMIHKEQRIGLVLWQNEKESICADICYYQSWYENITHWMPIPKQPNK